MAYPAGVSLATVSVGSTFSAFGDTATISVKVTPFFGGLKRIVWTATGEPMVAFSKTYKGAPGEGVSFQVPHVDQEGFVTPAGDAYTMWAYVADVSVSEAGETLSWSQSFQPLVGQSSIDLDEVPEGGIVPEISAPLPAVLSVNGQTGHVTGITGDGGAALPDGGTVNHLLQGPDEAPVWLLKSDLPVSTAVQNALNAKADTSALSAKADVSQLSTKADLVDGKVPVSQIPAVALVDTFPVASQAAMLALTAQKGDVAVRTDSVASGGGRSYILMAEPATTLSNWVEMPSIGQVSSVAGRVGAVTLGITDIANLQTELNKALLTLSSGTPNNAWGVDSQWLWRMSDKVLFEKVSGAWVNRGAITGGGTAAKPIMKEVFGQEGDAQVTIVGQESISNYARKILPLWRISNDNVLPTGQETTCRLFYRDSAGVEQQIAQNLTIPAGARAANVTLTGTLPTVPAQRELYCKATVAPPGGTGTPAPATYTLGTFVSTLTTSSNQLQLPIPSGKIGKIAIVAVASTTGAPTLPVPTTGPGWTTIISRSDTAASLWSTIAWKPIQADETVYTMSFAGSYVSAGGVIVLDTFEPTNLFDPEYAIAKMVDLFQNNPGTVPTDDTTLDQVRVLRFYATRSSANEFQNLTITGNAAKIAEGASQRTDGSNVAMTVATEVQTTPGTVTNPTVTSPYNSRWIVDGRGLQPYTQQLIGASNLTVHGEVEVQTP